MLAAFFDDSGTHKGSNYAVWGGLLGPLREFERLDLRWRDLLREPLADKPSLKKFSLTDCVNREREFEGYNQAERDLVRNRFRQAISDADLAPVAYVVDKIAWNEVLSDVTKEFLGEGQNMALDGCLEAAAKYSAGENKHISVHLDAGQLNTSSRAVVFASYYKNAVFVERSSIEFSAVESQTGLQAADMVAGEAYRYALRQRNASPIDLEPHFRDFVEKNGAVFMFLDHDAIKTMSDRLEPTFRKLKKSYFS